MMENCSLSTATVLLPDDANPAGNVHGGTILKMIEQAGHVVATRFCNAHPRCEPHRHVVGSLAQIYQMDFQAPMFIGNLAKVFAKPTFTSDRTVEVSVEVWAENLLTLDDRKTNSAILSYVAMDMETCQPIKGTIPQLICHTEDEERLFQEGLERYTQRKSDRPGRSWAISPCSSPMTPKSPLGQQPLAQPNTPHGKTVQQSIVSLVQVMLPGDCWARNIVAGGVIMKLMDNATGVCAAKFCRSNVVTACIDSLSFSAMVHCGDVVHLFAKPVFISAKSMDIEVTVEAERLFGGASGETQRVLATSGIFTYVSLDANHKPQVIPPLILESEEDQALFEIGQKRYEARKQARSKK